MSKICTSIEQSQKLVGLGISLNTADMYHAPDANIIVAEPYITKDENETLIPAYKGAIPAWSLSALLGLMPTDDKKDEYYVDTESHSDYHTVNYRNCWNGCIHSEYSEESLLDAAFKMIYWLLENKKYDKERIL